MTTNHNAKGFALIYLIVVMLILSGVGVAIYSLTSSSTYSELTENSRNRAYQLAVAGMNYAAERYYGGIDLNATSFKNTTYTLGNNRGKITYTVSIVTGAFQPYYDVISIGTVNDTNGALLAKAQVRSGSQPNSPNYFPYTPPVNQTVMTVTMEDTTAFKSQDLRDSSGHTMAQVNEYVATGGTHFYWLAFINQGRYPRSDGDNPGCNIGYQTLRINDTYAATLRSSWQTYYLLNYDVQVKVGWYKDFDAAVSGINFRWHETANGSGLFQGYGLSYMLYTYNSSGCGSGYDYIPFSIKPTKSSSGTTVNLTNQLLLVLWEQRVVSGVEKRRWLGYAILGRPASYRGTRTGNDLKVVGAQDSSDGLVSDDSLLMVRVKDTYLAGQRVNEINVFYADASPNYDSDAQRTPDSVAVNIYRKRMFPQWIRSDLFPSWPSNRFGLYSDSSGSPTNIYNFWTANTDSVTDLTTYDFFTLVSASDKIGPIPPATNKINNPVQWVINPDYLDSRSDTSTAPSNTDLITLLDNKATMRTYKFTLATYNSWDAEIGLHGMGSINSSDQVVAFDDLALQILGR